MKVDSKLDPDSEFASVPGWYFLGLAAQAIALVGALGLCIYGVMLYVGYKNVRNGVYPDMEMK